MQRVVKAEVSVEGETIAEIKEGMCVLVGFEAKDTEDDVSKMADRICKLRLWEDDKARPWKVAMSGASKELLLVSQFTLYCDVKSNGMPSFKSAMGSVPAEGLYNLLIDTCHAQSDKGRVHAGKFGAYMTVNIANDGPVTIVLES